MFAKLGSFQVRFPCEYGIFFQFWNIKYLTNVSWQSATLVKLTKEKTSNLSQQKSLLKSAKFVICWIV
jgi:hypothetical protein